MRKKPRVFCWTGTGVAASTARVACALIKSLESPLLSLAQLHPLVLPQFSHLWHAPFGTISIPHSLQVGAPSCALVMELETGAIGFIAGGIAIITGGAAGIIAVPAAPASTGADPF